jgi:hypothetical protein
MSGISPLTPEGPTGTLQAITYAAAQGQTIDTTGTPTEAMAGINTTTTNVPTAQTTAQTLGQGNGGALIGTPPSIFNRDTDTTDNFILGFKGWRAVNWNKAPMVNAYARTALILTFIKGENVNDWVSHQLDLLIERIKNGIKHSDEAHWDLFEVDFMTAFVNTGSQQTAYTQLEKCSMVGDNLDLYISTFNRLLKQAGFQASDLGSVKRFKKGLPKQLRVACLKRRPEPITMIEWQQTAKEENLVHLKIQQLLKSDPKYTPLLQKPFHFQQKFIPQQGGTHTRYWKPKGPNAINVDTTQTTNPRTQGKWERKKDTHECFFCKKQGHIKRDCYTFQCAVKEGTAKPYQDKPTQNRVTKIVDNRTEADASLTPQQFTQMIKEMDEEARASAIEEMIAQDFSMGPN